MEKKTPVLSARMFGQEEIRYGDTPILSGKNKITKSLELLLLLLYSGEAGIARNRLMESLYGIEEVADTGNSLRVTVHRLRKLLKDAGLPEGEYIQVREGVYRWDSFLPCSVDVWEFQRLMDQAEEEPEEEKKAELLRRVCDMYRGEFLPKLSGQEWVLIAEASYKKEYAKALEWLIGWLKKRREYDEILKLADMACRIYPFEEWQCVKIEAYIAQNRYKEALEEYENATRLFSEELGVAPSERMMELFGEMSRHISSRPNVVREIQEGLREDRENSGAFYCSAPSFRDMYRMVQRSMERTGKSVYLLVCSITDNKGRAMENGEKLDEMSKELYQAIEGSLRRGDAFTKYSASQYLVMLLGINKENCQIVIDRITTAFAREHGSWSKRLHCSVASLYDTEG